MSGASLHPVRLYRQLLRRWRIRSYRRDVAVAEERSKLEQVGLLYDRGLARLNQALAALDRPPYDPDRDSVHWLICACLSLETDAPNGILELGTFDGNFTAILAALFPASRIVTVDLPESDPILRSTYERRTEAEYEAYRQRRTRNIAHGNVTAIERNSLFLLDAVTGPFDIVWVDAGHLFPAVAWDIANALHLCAPGGVILCDDVVLHESAYSTSGLVNSDSYRVLSYLAPRIDAPITYFRKRWSARRSGDPATCKYVSFLRKPQGRATP